MLTFQDFVQAGEDKVSFIQNLIEEHKAGELYRTAVDADLYDRQKNRTINEYVQIMYDMFGASVENYVASNNKIASNFFHRLNTQRVTYSLGNGVSFTAHVEKTRNEEGVEVSVDTTKERLGAKFDSDLKRVVYKASIHGVSFGYWNSRRLYCYPVTEFAPLWDEMDGTLRAGVRFWRLAPEKPMIAVLYEEDGYTTYQTDEDSDALREVTPKTAYKLLTRSTPADGEVIVGTENYGSLPVVPMWGSALKQSTLVGMREAIDSYDLIRSGFANDLTDCSEMYWILENYGGMTDADLQRFRDRMKFMHIVEMDTSGGGGITPYTQEIPYSARSAYLEMIKAGIYEDFGGLDVHQVSADSTNDHLEAAYQPLDENADDLEYQIIEFVQQLLALEGIEDTPIFKRNRISNQAEQTNMILSAAEYLDTKTVVSKLPFVTVDEVNDILARSDQEAADRYNNRPIEEEDEEDEVIPEAE